MKVMAKAARDAAAWTRPTMFKRRLAYLEDRALRRAYFADKIAAGVTAEAVQAAYDQFVADFQPEEEVHARHILVATEDDAKAIKAELDARQAVRGAGQGKVDRSARASRMAATSASSAGA